MKKKYLLGKSRVQRTRSICASSHNFTFMNNVIKQGNKLEAASLVILAFFTPFVSSSHPRIYILLEFINSSVETIMKNATS